MILEMFFMETYKSPKSGKTNLVFSEEEVSPEEVEAVQQPNETVRGGNVMAKFAGKAVKTYGEFKQVESGIQVIVPLNGKYNFAPEELTKMREKKHSIIKGQPITYKSGRESTFRFLGKLNS